MGVPACVPACVLARCQTAGVRTRACICVCMGGGVHACVCVCGCVYVGVAVRACASARYPGRGSDSSDGQCGTPQHKGSVIPYAAHRVA